MNANQLKSKIEGLYSKSFNEVVNFLKSTTIYHYAKFKNEYSEIFWHSELPIKWIKEISSTSFIEEFLFGYFSKPENANSEFLKTALSHCSIPLIKILKLSKSFENIQHWQTFAVFEKYYDKRFQLLYKELSFIKKIISDWDSKSIYYKTIVEKFDYEDILIHTISYYEKFKRSSKLAQNNRTHIVRIEMNLNYVLNEILNIKKNKYISENRQITNKYLSSEFKDVIKEILPPLNPIEGIAKGKYLPNEKITDDKKIIREAIEFFFAFHVLKYQIDIYLGGFAEFETIDNFEAEIITNSDYSIYQKNDNKSVYDEIFFTNKASEKNDFLAELKKQTSLYDKETLLSIYSSIEYFKYLKLPLEYQTKYYGTIDFSKVLKLLKIFSIFLMPSGRQVFTHIEETENGKSLNPVNYIKRTKPTEFLEYFKEEYIICFDEKELLFNCEMFFNWSREEIENIINYLTTDLSVNRNFKINYLERPFIKIGNQYFWLSSLLNRRWEVMLHRRIVNERLLNHNIQSARIEKLLADEFIKAGFNAISSYCLPDKSGEIDTLVYKDKRLFLIEIKTTYGEENLIRNEEYSSRKFIYKATEQIERNKKYIKENFEKEFRRIPELKINCDFEELQIVPLIISNIYDTDDYYINSKFLKLSLFELIVILNNDLYSMLNYKSGKALFDSDFEIHVPFLFQQINSFAPEFKKSILKTDKESCNLWTDEKQCSATDLITAIKEDKIWKFLNELKHLNYYAKLDLKQFNPNHRFII